MRYVIQKAGAGRSFPEGDAFLQGQSASDAAEIIIYSGVLFKPDEGRAAILIELENECLADYVDESDPANVNVLGFARYRNGTDQPSKLVELVRHPNNNEAAVSAARHVFEAAGLEVVVCSDQVGRIINRLVVPKYNAALRFLDEGLATQSDMDLTCKLGLGYPDGPIERVLRGGLRDHYKVSKTLFDAYGTAAFVPPRRAAVAIRHKLGEADETSE
jgi:3-hydroxybutyryl-CoA dehydrogenase